METCRPVIAPKGSGGIWVTWPSNGHRVTQCAVGDRRGVRDQRDGGRFQRGEVEGDEHHRADCDGRATPGQRFQKGAKRESDHDAWMRRSSLMVANARRSTAKCPVLTVRL